MPLKITPQIQAKLLRTPQHLRTHSSVIQALEKAAVDNKENYKKFNQQLSQHLYNKQITALIDSMNALVVAMKSLPSEVVLESQIKNTEEQKAIKAEVHLERLFACETMAHVRDHIWPVLQPKDNEVIDLQYFPKTIELLEEANRVFIKLIKKEKYINTATLEKLVDEVIKNKNNIKSQYDSLEKRSAIKPNREKILLFVAIVIGLVGLTCMASMALMTAWPLMMAVLMAGVIINLVAAAIYLKHQSEKDKRLDEVPHLKRHNKMYQLHKSTLFRVDEVRELLELPAANKDCSPVASPSSSPELTIRGTENVRQ